MADRLDAPSTATNSGSFETRDALARILAVAARRIEMLPLITERRSGGRRLDIATAFYLHVCLRNMFAGAYSWRNRTHQMKSTVTVNLQATPCSHTLDASRSSSSLRELDGGALFLAVAMMAAGLPAAGCGSDNPTNGPMAGAEFVYSELTAGGRPIRYLLDANDAGQMVGSVPGITPGSTDGLDGFVLGANGTADFWTTADYLAYPTAINNAGQIVGTNVPIAGGLPEGFERDADGNEMPYNFGDALGTVVFGISDDDTYSGFYITSEGRRGFVEQPSTGLSRSVEFPGAVETQLYGINNEGKAGGAYYDAMARAFPFIYDIASDTYEEITPPTQDNYIVSSINDDGDAIVFGLRDVTESYADLRSFYRDGETGEMTELFYPGADETYGYDIDNQGQIIGYYLSDSGTYGGFRAESL